MNLPDFQVSDNNIVISVPGATSGAMGLKQFAVYEYPATDDYRYRQARYITARSKTGSMKRVYRIDHFLVFNPALPEQVREHVANNARLSTDEKRRLSEFLQQTALTPDRQRLMRYFVTSETLLNLAITPSNRIRYFPRLDGEGPGQNNMYRCYVSLAELASGKRYIQRLKDFDYKHLAYYP